MMNFMNKDKYIDFFNDTNITIRTIYISLLLLLLVILYPSLLYRHFLVFFHNPYHQLYFNLLFIIMVIIMVIIIQFKVV